MPKLSGSGAAPAKIDINMTPMIDVVFQLLTFFLMTFKVASVEGDFNLRLPKVEVGGGAGPFQPPDRILLRLTALSDGELEAIHVNAQPLLSPSRDVYARLHEQIERLENTARSAGFPELEVEIDADDRLRYEHVIQTVAAISTRTDETGAVVPLIQKVKFTQK